MLLSGRTYVLVEIYPCVVDSATCRLQVRCCQLKSQTRKKDCGQARGGRKSVVASEGRLASRCRILPPLTTNTMLQKRVIVLKTNTSRRTNNPASEAGAGLHKMTLDE